MELFRFEGLHQCQERVNSVRKDGTSSPSEPSVLGLKTETDLPLPSQVDRVNHMNFLGTLLSPKVRIFQGSGL